MELQICSKPDSILWILVLIARMHHPGVVEDDVARLAFCNKPLSLGFLTVLHSIARQKLPSLMFLSNAETSSSSVKLWLLAAKSASVIRPMSYYFSRYTSPPPSSKTEPMGTQAVSKIGVRGV